MVTPAASSTAPIPLRELTDGRMRGALKSMASLSREAFMAKT
jgi:hypothetical protein